MSREPTLTRSLVRGLAWSGLNSIVMRLGGLFVGVLIARLMAPRDFGVFAVGLAAQTILLAMAELGMSADLIRHGDIDRRAPTVATIGLLSSGCLAAIACVAAGPVASLMGSGEAAGIIRVLSITLVLSGVSAVPYARAQRNFMQSQQFVADGVGLVVSTGLTVALLSVGVGPMALAWSRVVGQFLSTSMQFRFTRTAPRFGFDPVIARSVLRFGTPLAMANLLSWLLLNVDYMIVGHLSGATQLGLYVLAFSLSSWPTTAISQALRSVALPGFARLQTRPVELSCALRYSASLALALALPLSLFLLVFSREAVQLVYGAQWAASAPALAGLAAFGALRVVFDVLATFQVAIGRSRQVLVIQVLWLLALTPAMYSGVLRDGIRGAAWAHLLVATMVILPAYLMAVARCEQSAAMMLRALWAPCLAGAPAVAVAITVGRHVEGAASALVCGGLAGGFVYVLCLQQWVRHVVLAFRQLLAEVPDGQPVPVVVGLPGSSASPQPLTVAGTQPQGVIST